MAKQEKLPNFKIAKGLEYKGWPKNTKVMLIEPKYDGLRAIILVRGRKAKAYTSNGVEVPNAKHICQALEKLEVKNYMLDGEFFCEDWNKTTSIVKTQSEHPDGKELKLRLFDIMSIDQWDTQNCPTVLEQRKDTLTQLLISIGMVLPEQDVYSFNLTPGEKVTSDKEVQKLFKKYCQQGHEGAMLKDLNSPYEFKKSKQWLKLKPYQELDCRVIGTLDGKGKYQGLIGSLVCEGEVDGKRVEFATSGMEDEIRKKLTELHHKRKLKGMVVEVKHEGVTVNNGVRFPRIYRIRWDKNKP